VYKGTKTPGHRKDKKEGIYKQKDAIDYGSTKNHVAVGCSGNLVSLYGDGEEPFSGQYENGLQSEKWGVWGTGLMVIASMMPRGLSIHQP